MLPEVPALLEPISELLPELPAGALDGAGVLPLVPPVPPGGVAALPPVLPAAPLPALLSVLLPVEPPGMLLLDVLPGVVVPPAPGEVVALSVLLLVPVPVVPAVPLVVAPVLPVAPELLVLLVAPSVVPGSFFPHAPRASEATSAASKTEYFIYVPLRNIVVDKCLACLRNGIAVSACEIIDKNQT